ncbi:MAG: hypothetical protein NTW96_26280 [Planctomycetia bacterium]|nr:hypothetical protein [Planctomycetia bacterium]
MTDQHEASNDEVWRAIVEIHNESKALFLLCEELEPRHFKAFLQPFNELRHAYEHAIRCMANQLRLDERSPDKKYQLESLNKTLGHEYRGFFDSADWLAIILREEIRTVLQPYSPACILASLPEYYSQDRIRVVEISEAIAKLRGDKDVARQRDADEAIAIAEPSVLIGEVRKYKAILSDLLGVHKKVIAAVPGLEEYKARSLAEERRQATWSILMKTIAGLAVAAIIGAVGYLWTVVTTKTASETPVEVRANSAAEP